MYLIGLTGGIASGKSVVAARLAELGAVHVDADVLAREVVAPGTRGLGRIVEEFGPGVLAADGSLERGALGDIIFPSPDRRAALNHIVHPEVWRRAQELFDEARKNDENAIIVYDVPLLVEASADRPMGFDLIVVVHASVETRVRRLVELRGMTREEASHRINSQASDAERLAVADVVIDSDGTLEQTIRQTDALWQQVTANSGTAKNSVSRDT
ncbi:MAG: dephospho-CoA kinase [Salinibacterium sp.]|nr:MAG: dephospho-CoA kinase [Salinibacterium sp.]